MSYGELYLEPVRSYRNPVNGRFLKGHTPANKGRKWCEYLSKRKQKSCSKGWKNLELHRNNGGGPNSGRPKKQVIAMSDEGKFVVFPSIKAAASYYGIRWENIARCCRHNQTGTLDRKGLVNTDHKYFGFRFYFESDNVWLQKINK